MAVTQNVWRLDGNIDGVIYFILTFLLHMELTHHSGGTLQRVFLYFIFDMFISYQTVWYVHYSLMSKELDVKQVFMQN